VTFNGYYYFDTSNIYNINLSIIKRSWQGHSRSFKIKTDTVGLLGLYF